MELLTFHITPKSHPSLDWVPKILELLILFYGSTSIVSRFVQRSRLSSFLMKAHIHSISGMLELTQNEPQHVNCQWRISHKRSNTSSKEHSLSFTRLPGIKLTDRHRMSVIDSNRSEKTQSMSYNFSKTHKQSIR